ncbi:MAG: hypothetical protein WCQ21_02705 [Verrucomicrobiota bacterium]
MSTAWSYTSSSPGPDPKLARAVARKLCRDSLAWARTLVVSARAPRGRRGSAPAGRNAADTRSAAGEAQLEDELFIEVLAYGLCLVEMRLSAATPAGQDGLATLVRYECSVLLSQATWRRQNRYQRLPAPNPALSDSRYAQLYPAHGAESGRQARLTREMFQQFCHCTGLGSDVLVGKGENLATLVFYIAVHGVRSARGLPTRDEVLRLLRAASECRTRMQRAISQWLATEPQTQPAIAAPRPPTCT